MNEISQESIYASNQLLIDVRSPSEYLAYHIEGAVNLPLFTDEERAAIGTAYKQESTVIAKKLGTTYIANKIEMITHELIDYSLSYDRIIIYCQRGGMRSGSIVSLMNSLDFNNIFRLDGGIKGHRNYVMSELPKILANKDFVTIHGLTGVGKTKILNAMEEDYLVLNYEKLAQNSGSVFGNILFRGDSPTQKQFEEKLFFQIQNSAKHVFIESESKRVGSLLIPDEYMEKLETGEHILVETSIDNRIQNLIDDYSFDDNHAALKGALNKLRKRLGNDVTDNLIDYIDTNQLPKLVNYLLVDYYDPLYNYSINQYDYKKIINYKSINEVLEYIHTTYEKGK